MIIAKLYSFILVFISSPVVHTQSTLEFVKAFAGQADTNVTIYQHEGGNNVYLLHFSTEHWSGLVSDRLQRTTKVSHKNDCLWATNGGPYNADGSGIGLVISHGEIRHESYGGVGFGLTRDGTRWVIGTPSVSDVPYLSEFVTGFDWLVRDGSLVNSTDTTGAALSARTAIGVDWQGRLILMVVDGCEKCIRRRGRGVNLTTLSNEMIRAGARHAVNMDGGGSTVLVHDHRVMSRPTCMDIPIPCERKVATAFCIREKDKQKERMFSSSSSWVVQEE